MNESFPSPEANKVEKQEVINLYKKLIEKEIATPDDLDLSDPQVVEANEKYEEYFKQKREAVKGDKEAELNLDLEQTLFYLDAGFTDPSYAEDVLLDFAMQDWQNAKDYPELAEKMKVTIQEYITKFLPGVDPEEAFKEEEE